MPSGVYTRKLNPKSAPSEYPTTQDIAWAAGIYEGEGWCAQDSKSRIKVGQKDPWLPERLRALFGGSVYMEHHSRISDGYHREDPFYVWALSGARARGFLMSIYGLLSPRRKAYIARALEL